MIRCPNCNAEARGTDRAGKIIDGREAPGGIRRRWKCLKCNSRWTTLEVVVEGTDGRGTLAPPTLLRAEPDHGRRLVRSVEALLKRVRRLTGRAAEELAKVPAAATVDVWLAQGPATELLGAEPALWAAGPVEAA